MYCKESTHVVELKKIFAAGDEMSYLKNIKTAKEKIGLTLMIVGVIASGVLAIQDTIGYEFILIPVAMLIVGYVLLSKKKKTAQTVLPYNDPQEEISHNNVATNLSYNAPQEEISHNNVATNLSYNAPQEEISDDNVATNDKKTICKQNTMKMQSVQKEDRQQVVWTLCSGEQILFSDGTFLLNGMPLSVNQVRSIETQDSGLRAYLIYIGRLATLEECYRRTDFVRNEKGELMLNYFSDEKYLNVYERAQAKDIVLQPMTMRLYHEETEQDCISVDLHISVDGDLAVTKHTKQTEDVSHVLPADYLKTHSMDDFVQFLSESFNTPAEEHDFSHIKTDVYVKKLFVTTCMQCNKEIPIVQLLPIDLIYSQNRVCKECMEKLTVFAKQQADAETIIRQVLQKNHWEIEEYFIKNLKEEMQFFIFLYMTFGPHDYTYYAAKPNLELHRRRKFKKTEEGWCLFYFDGNKTPHDQKILYPDIKDENLVEELSELIIREKQLCEITEKVRQIKADSEPITKEQALQKLRAKIIASIEQEPSHKYSIVKYFWEQAGYCYPREHSIQWELAEFYLDLYEQKIFVKLGVYPHMWERPQSEVFNLPVSKFLEKVFLNEQAQDFRFMEDDDDLAALFDDELTALVENIRKEEHEREIRKNAVVIPRDFYKKNPTMQFDAVEIVWNEYITVKRLELVQKNNEYILKYSPTQSRFRHDTTRVLSAPQAVWVENLLNDYLVSADEPTQRGEHIAIMIYKQGKLCKESAAISSKDKMKSAVKDALLKLAVYASKEETE